MSHRVLIVSPNFPPINTPDHQRVRMSLPYFQEFGWEPYVLALRHDVRRGCVEHFCDSLLEQTVPSDIKVVRTGALPVMRIRTIGEAALAFRCLPYLLTAGGRIIVEERIDLVYFSTTMFPVMALGAGWHNRYGIPYVLDFQDPWLSDYYSRPGAPNPPGGRVKYGLSQAIARLLEPYALGKVSHAISVSPAYPKILLDRYSWLREDQFTVLPFGAAERDFEYLSSLNIQQRIFDPNDGKLHWVYVGRGGDDMALALRILFLAIRLSRERNPAVWNSIRLHFIGTDYAAMGDRAVKTVEPIARGLGITDLVEEYSHRVPYFEALQIQANSDAVILIGSDDPGYTASKLYPSILARKAILAIFHEQSSVVEILRRCKAGRVVTFASNQNPTDLLDEMTSQIDWLLSIPKGYTPDTNWSEFQPYTAREMTRQQCEIFDECLISSARMEK